MPDTHRFRAIFISDIHLATRGCKTDYLLDFLRHSESEYLYLVGDIFDALRMRKSLFWPQLHNDVVQKLLRKVRKGTRVTLIPGNHDAPLRQYLDLEFGGIVVSPEAVHETADGRRLLVLHGDQFDGVVLNHKWLESLGDSAYCLALSMNHWFNVARRKLGYSYWSLSAFLKERVKNAVEYVTSYKGLLVDEARKRGFDGIVCGHLHKAEIELIDGILYCNDGDWVESCTALVEHLDGRLEVIEWAHVTHASEQVARVRAQEANG